MAPDDPKDLGDTVPATKGLDGIDLRDTRPMSGPPTEPAGTPDAARRDSRQRRSATPPNEKQERLSASPPNEKYERLSITKNSALDQPRATWTDTQRSLPETQAEPLSARALDGRFRSIENQLTQLEARLRLLEKRRDGGGGRQQVAFLWAIFLLVLIVAWQLISKRG